MVDTIARLFGPTSVIPQVGPLSLLNLTVTAMLQLFTIQRLPDSYSVRVHCGTPWMKRDEEPAAFGPAAAVGCPLVEMVGPASGGADAEEEPLPGAVASALTVTPQPGGIAVEGGIPAIPASKAAMKPEIPRAQGS